MTFDGKAADAKYEQSLADRRIADTPDGFAVAPKDIVFEEPIVTEKE